MKPLPEWLLEYGVSHQHPANRGIHRICVPLIFLSLVGALSCVHWPEWWLINLAVGAMMPALWFYARLGRQVFLFMLAFCAVALGLAYEMFLLAPRPIFWWAGIFLVGWTGQFIGHSIEGKKPSFFEDLQFLLIGPLWVFRRH